jgi:hypothetical protein
MIRKRIREGQYKNVDESEIVFENNRKKTMFAEVCVTKPKKSPRMRFFIKEFRGYKLIQTTPDKFLAFCKRHNIKLNKDVERNAQMQQMVKNI